MRDFQTKNNTGAVPDSIATNKFGAGEFNSLALELESAVSRSGQTLSPADGTGDDPTQLAKSLFIHSVKSQSFQDNGTANNYQLTPVSGASGVLLPTDYSNLEGARIAFVAGNSNTGAATVNIGQTIGSLLGAKALLSAAGLALAAGQIVAGNRYEIVYDPAANMGAGAWIITSWSEELILAPINITAVLQDQKPSGTAGGTFTSGAWRTRDLNSFQHNNISGLSVNANQMNIPNGTYLIQARVPSYDVDSHKAKLYNVSDAVDVIIGTTENNSYPAVTSTNVMNSSIVSGRFTVAGGPKLFEIRHISTETKTTTGFGIAINVGVVEIYTSVFLQKIGD